MNNLKPYIGRYLEKPIYLNLHEQFGWYLKYDNKLYGVPMCFQDGFDLNKAIKIIDFKNKKKEEEKIERPQEEEDQNIRQGKAKDFLNPNNKPVFKK
jgi:hypothetical protein